MLKVRDILRFTRIPLDWRKQYQIDGVILTNDKVLFWEHDKDTEHEKQIVGKMRKLMDCHVIWTCPHEERLSELLALAPTDDHWFTTYNDIISDPHGVIFQNRAGQWAALEIDTAFSEGVQLGVQLGATDQP